jgi:hypothetical protein
VASLKCFIVPINIKRFSYEAISRNLLYKAIHRIQPYLSQEVDIFYQFLNHLANAEEITLCRDAYPYNRDRPILKQITG